MQAISVESKIKSTELPFSDVSYDVSNDGQRVALSNDLTLIAQVIFTELENWPLTQLIRERAGDLIESFKSLGQYNSDTIIYRWHDIDKALQTFVDLFNSLWVYRDKHSSSNYRVRDRDSGKINKLSKKLNKLINNRLSIGEIATLINHPPKAPVITLTFSDLNPSLQERLAAPTRSSSPDWKFLGSNLSLYEAKKATTENSPEASTSQWLASLSSDVLNEYSKTEEILSEVTPLLDNAEDEYFVEQISAEYYPHIFAALQNFDKEATDFHHKEVVVTEAVKQFKIVQLGLQKIIDGTVTRHMNAMRLQTDFLRNKVLGDQSFSLSPTEADSLLESSIEEAQRVRDDLYKKHVAPILEKNKQEYDDALSAARIAAENHLNQALEAKEKKYSQMLQLERKQNDAKLKDRSEQLDQMQIKLQEFQARLQEFGETATKENAANQRQITQLKSLLEEERKKSFQLERLYNNERVKYKQNSTRSHHTLDKIERLRRGAETENESQREIITHLHGVIASLKSQNRHDSKTITNPPLPEHEVFTNEQRKKQLQEVEQLIQEQNDLIVKAHWELSEARSVVDFSDSSEVAIVESFESRFQQGKKKLNELYLRQEKLQKHLPL